MKTKQSYLFCSLISLSLSVATAAERSFVTGISEATYVGNLAASVPGIVSVWKVKEGDAVNTNDTIVELDNQLERLESDRRRLVMENRKTDFNALQTLVKKASISIKKEELEKAETEYKIALAEYEIAVEQLRKRSVLSPRAGVIVKITRQVGEACEPYQPLVRLVDPRQCRFTTGLEPKATEKLVKDQTVELEFETGGKPVTIHGKIEFLSPEVHAASGLQEVRVLFDNTANTIRPGIAGKMFLE
jgi:membrane fusion protein, multidrug efflux system